MSDTPLPTGPSSPDADPLDEEAATIDARSPEAADQIEHLAEHAERLGRDPDRALIDE
ncbi:MAG: hypothetical protein ABIW84_11190 [Ilumatobacteraceae bacterium]